jgi:hypothetical protein
MEWRLLIKMSNLLDLLKDLGVPIETKVFIETFNQVNYEYVYQMQMALNLVKHSE